MELASYKGKPDKGERERGRSAQEIEICAEVPERDTKGTGAAKHSKERGKEDNEKK